LLAYAAQNIEQNQNIIKAPNESFENVTNFKYLGIRVTKIAFMKQLRAG